MAKSTIPEGIFASPLSRQESKAQMTDGIARTIMQTEAKAREAKTARLRDLRLRKEAETPPPPVKKTRVKQS